jgi:ATP/maltotriose-dependent transcriptional regulator MalT
VESVTPSELVGRNAQLAELTRALQQVTTGNSATVLVAGEAGIGKSRLIGEFAESARARGAAVTIGQCVDLDDHGSAFAPIAGMLRGLIEQVGLETFVEAAGPGRWALGGLVPELAEGAPAPLQTPSQLFDVIAVLLEQLAAQRPVVLVVEDLQWADSSTRSLVRFLARYLTSARVLFVVTYRSDDVHRRHPLRPLLAELDRIRSVVRLEVPRLTQRDVGRLLANVLGTTPEPATVARMYERTGGNPFFVEELAATESQPRATAFPEALRDVLLVRVEQLAPATQQILRTFSICGTQVSHEVALAVTGVESGALDAALREAVEANVMRASSDSYTFRHALLREALYDDHLPGERVRVHTRCALLFAERPDLAGGRSPAGVVAHHWNAAFQPEKAFAAYLEAAADAENVHAHAEVHEVLERVLELWDQVPDPAGVASQDRVAVLARAARAASDAGELRRALTLIDGALAELDPVVAPVRHGDLLYQRVELARELGRADWLALLTDALDDVPAVPASAARARLVALHARHHLLDDRPIEAIAVAEEALEMAGEVGDSYAAVRARTILGPALVMSGRAADGLDVLREAERGASPDRRLLAMVHNNHAYALAVAGSLNDAADVVERGLAHARGLGIVRTGVGVVLQAVAAELALDRGRWNEAEQVIDRSIELDLQAFQSEFYRLHAELRLWRGDLDGAARELMRRRGQHHYEMSGKFRVPIARTAAELALARGDLVAGWDAVDRELSAEQPVSHLLRLVAVAARVVGARIRAGDTVPASDIARVRAAGQRFRHWPAAPQWLTLVDAELGGGRGTDPAAWKLAVKQSDAAEGPVVMRPYARYRLGEALLGQGDRDEARLTLGTARSQAGTLGAALLTNWIDELAQRAGLTSLEPAPVSTAYHLTGRERDVLSLVERGLTNREIGQRLFISAKTVSVHISNSLAKLGVSGRREAAALARREGLLEAP